MPVHKDIESLDPSVQEQARNAIEDMREDETIRAAGYTVIVLETRRDPDVQMAYASRLLASYVDPKYRKLAVRFVQAMYRAAGLYEIGAEEALRPNTWTLDSRHFGGTAFDVAPSKDGKTADWKAPQAVWSCMGEIGEAHGFEWGGRWVGDQVDSPHFQRR